MHPDERNITLPSLTAATSSLNPEVEPLAYEVMFIFNRRFGSGEEVVLLKPTKGEPQYIASVGHNVPSEILFANGFVGSALHEVAHWCIAGKARRLLDDYGYWYKPDGRNEKEQEEFFEVEAKPQALEWIFSLAIQRLFFVSCDNLKGELGDLDKMRRKVADAAKKYLTAGLPIRAQFFLDDLLEHFSTHQIFNLHTEKIIRDQAIPN